ncbi:MAG: cytochrome c biogenesis protein CcsA [Clostridia bacterium]|nr:cytochrome c biogenesis protein CcsA [Clostridia bacterium]
MAKKALTWLTYLSVLAATYLVFMWVPNEKVMGPVQKIFYFHVAAAWVGFFAFLIVFLCGVAYLVTRAEKWDLYGASSAEIGVLFTTIVLITGPIWARPTWNAWWTWDPRLTTTLVLWFIYLAYLMVRTSFPEPEKRMRFSAIFGIIGFIDVPIVWFSIRWWRTIHPVVVDGSGFAMSSKMLTTLLVSLVAFTLLYLYLLTTRVAVARIDNQIQRIKEAVLR